MIYKGLNRTGIIGDIKTKGGGEIAEVYGGIGESNPIYYKQREMVGTSPMYFKGLGQPLKDYHIFGETVQDGTPTPTSPIYPQECGDRTENLLDDVILQNNKGLDINGSVTDYSGRVTTSKPIDVSNTPTVTLTYTGTGVIYFIYATFKSGILVERYATAYTGWTINTSDCDELRICFYSMSASSITKDDISNIMLNTGSNPLPYEPYGYKLPLNLNDTTQNLYLSEPLRKIGDYADSINSDGTVERKIKKLVLTGEEVTWGQYVNNRARFVVSPRDILNSIGSGFAISDRYNSTYSVPQLNNNSVENAIAAYEKKIYIYTNGDYDIDTYKSYLSQQYTNGTPVTVWYVLMVPTTEQVTVPTLTPATGNNTLAIGTTLQPSSVSITGHIKPTGYGQLVDKNGAHILDKNDNAILVHSQ